MTPNLRWQKLTLQLRNPFSLSYGVSEVRSAFWIRLKNDEGWGEGTIPPYYGISEQEMVTFWQDAAEKPEAFPDEISQIVDWIGTEGPAPARCALDLAFHDRLARLLHLPLYKLLGIPTPEPKPSAFTIAADTPEAAVEMAARMKLFPIIKLKLGRDSNDIDILRAVRHARPGVRIWVDANAGWNPDDAIRLLMDLERLHVELLEQPLEKLDFEGMGSLQSKTSIPIVADESVQTADDIEALAKCGVKGVNVKLMKVGGLSPGLKMIKQAKDLGMRVMLGCMIETAIGTTAMAHLSSFADCLDLDASLLIIDDPFMGMTINKNAMVHIQPRPGIGVIKSASKAAN
jgi:L-alanine-DL-glutamate epimerase-like enolase superfamily enzyme